MYGNDGLWHLFGITHQEPADPMNEIHFAHATAKTLLQKPWEKQPFALNVAAKPWKEIHLWAPHVIRHDGLYYMFYCAGDEDHTKYKIHLATSKDLRKWTRHKDNPMVVDGFDARDPYVTQGGRQVGHVLHGHQQARAKATTLSPASPATIWCIGRIAKSSSPIRARGNGAARRNRPSSCGAAIPGISSSVPATEAKASTTAPTSFVSNDPFHWRIEDRVGHIASHAAEVVRDLDGKWYVSRCGWGEGGVYLAPLIWNDGLDDKPTNIPVPKANSATSERRLSEVDGGGCRASRLRSSMTSLPTTASLRTILTGH